MTDSFNKKVASKIKGVNTPFIFKYLSGRIKGQKQGLSKISMYIARYLSCVANKKHMSLNLMITAPSGCAKTETIRAINALLLELGIPIPVIQLDATDFTENGYSGKGTEEIARRIVDSITEVDNNGYAIVFIDEIDKVTSKSQYGDRKCDVIQAQLLTLVEGRMLNIRNENHSDGSYYNSKKTMFIFAGAYQDLRNRKAKDRYKGKKIGFVKEDGTETEKTALYEGLTMEELIENGIKEELAGRITDIINYERLEDDEMKNIIDIRKKVVEAEMECRITIKEKCLNELLSVSNGPTGVRECEKVIRSAVSGALGEYIINNEELLDKISGYEVIMDTIADVTVKPVYHDHDDNETDMRNEAR